MIDPPAIPGRPWAGDDGPADSRPTTTNLNQKAQPMTTATQARNRCHYAERLAAALGDGSRWEYRGDCCELPRAEGRCSCGHHGLRYLFTLHNIDNGRTAIVGSVCVFSYASITPATLDAIRADADRLEAAAADRARDARDAARQADVAAAVAEWSAVEYAVDAAVQSWRAAHPYQRWEPYYVYRRPTAGMRLDNRQPMHPFAKVPQLKTAAGIIARVRKETARARHVLDEVRGYQ